MQYELVVLVDSKTSEKEVEEKLKTLLTKEGFTVSGVESLGKKDLAYPLRKSHEALFMALSISGEKNPNTLMNRFKLEEWILRGLILKKGSN